MLKQEVEDKMRELFSPADIKRIVEVGSGWGESAKFFSELKPDATIYTVDSFGLYGDGRIYNRLDHDKVKAIIDGYGRNVIQILANSSTVPWELPMDVLFLDGDHTYDGCSKDWLCYSPFVVNGGFIVFDDYNQPNNPDNGVKQLVKDIMNLHPEGYELIYEGFYCAILVKKQTKWKTIPNY